MTLTTLTRALGAVTLAAILGGCVTHTTGEAQAKGPAAANASTTSDSLAQTGWELTRWADQGGKNRTLPANGAIRLNFLASGDQYTVSGHSGCNPYTGAYKLADHKLFVTVRGSGRMACASSSDSALEKAYLNGLGKISDFSLDNGGAPRQLTFTLADGDTLVYQRREDPPKP